MITILLTLLTTINKPKYYPLPVEEKQMEIEIIDKEVDVSKLIEGKKHVVHLNEDMQVESIEEIEPEEENGKGWINLNKRNSRGWNNLNPRQ